MLFCAPVFYIMGLAIGNRYGGRRKLAKGVVTASAAVHARTFCILLGTCPHLMVNWLSLASCLSQW